MPGSFSDMSVLAALTASVVDAAAAIGLDAAELRARAGLEAGVLADPDARVPLERHLALWRELARRPVGLEIGARLGPSGLGVVGWALQQAATVKDALEFLGRYQKVVHPDVVPRPERRTERGEERLVFARPVAPAFTALREPVLAQAAALVSMLQALGGVDVRARRVSLPLPRGDDAQHVAAFFGCDVAWSQPELEVAFSASVLERTVPRSDPRLFGYLGRRAAELHEQLPAEDRFADRARREVAQLLAAGEPRLDAVARRLGVSGRTLHRRLQEEGTGFAAIVDDARRARALVLLEDRHLSASEVAFLLGYAEPAPFFRAFRRWTGETPQAWRAARG